MPALLNVERATRNEDFRSRLQAALVLVSMEVLNANNNDDPRNEMAASIIASPTSGVWLTTFLWATAATVSGEVDSYGKVTASDEAVLQAVRDVWRKYLSGGVSGG